MSLYPILWAAEHAPIYDAEERAILVALTMKGDFDGMNCFRSYGTLAKAARVDQKTAGRKCRAMESRGILRRQTRHLSPAYRRIPKEQRPVAWEVMIPAVWWSAAQLEDINEQRAALGRPPITPENRPVPADAPPKKTRADKGTKRPRKAAQTTDPGTTNPGVDPGTTSPHPRDYKSPPQGLQVPQPSETPSETHSEKTAPSARSAGGVRSTSTSGSGARGHSGSAAPGKDGSSSGKTGKTLPQQHSGEELTRRQTAAVHAVEALLPPLLVAELPYGHIPQRNRAAVLEALESRTVDQLRERITARWLAYGYEPATHAGELRSAVGAALELIAPTRHCPDLACEDGTLIDTGADCRACSERKAQRRADRLAGKTPAPRGKGRVTAECLDCGHPFPGAVPQDSLCTPCREAPAAAVAAFLAREDQAAAARREAEALEEEAQRRRARRAARTAEAATPAAEDAEPDQAAADAEKDAQLRAELLAANPWMATYAQEPA